MKTFFLWLRRTILAIFRPQRAPEAAGTSGQNPSHAPAQPQPESRSAPMFANTDPIVPVDAADEVVDAAAAAEIPSTPQETVSAEPEVDDRLVDRQTDPTDAEITDEYADALIDELPEEPASTEIPAEDALPVPPVLPSELTGLLEALLFVCESPTHSTQFAQALGRPEADILAGLKDLQTLYKQTERGLRLQERNGRYSLVTAPQAASVIETFLNLDLSSHLSAPALEALAIVAYRQPVTKSQVEAVRGVDCGGVLRTLLQRGLIEEVGRLDTVGRPILYGVTDFFMQHFGLENMQELPPLQMPDADALWAATELAEE